MVNRQQLADLMGRHADTISDFTREGMPVVEKGGHGKESVYDAVACLSWFRDQQGTNPKDAAQARAANANADLNEQKLRVQRGELISKSAIVLAWQGVVKGWSTRLLSMPRRLVQLGVVSRENEAVVVGVVKELLADIAHWRGLEDSNAELPTQEVA